MISSGACFCESLQLTKNFYLLDERVSCLTEGTNSKGENLENSRDSFLPHFQYPFSKWVYSGVRRFNIVSIYEAGSSYLGRSRRKLSDESRTTRLTATLGKLFILLLYIPEMGLDGVFLP